MYVVGTAVLELSALCSPEGAARKEPARGHRVGELKHTQNKPGKDERKKGGGQERGHVLAEGGKHRPHRSDGSTSDIHNTSTSTGAQRSSPLLAHHHPATKPSLRACARGRAPSHSPPHVWPTHHQATRTGA